MIGFDFEVSPSNHRGFHSRRKGFPSSSPTHLKHTYPDILQFDDHSPLTKTSPIKKRNLNRWKSQGESRRKSPIHKSLQQLKRDDLPTLPRNTSHSTNEPSRTISPSVGVENALFNSRVHTIQTAGPAFISKYSHPYRANRRSSSAFALPIYKSKKSAELLDGIQKSVSHSKIRNEAWNKQIDNYPLRSNYNTTLLLDLPVSSIGTIPVQRNILLDGIKNISRFQRGLSNILPPSAQRTHLKIRRYIAKTLRVKTKRTGRSEFAELQACFRIFDTDRNGLIDSNDMVYGFKLLGALINENDIDIIINVYDTDKDGKIDYQEFIHMILYENHPILQQANLDFDVYSLHNISSRLSSSKEQYHNDEEGNTILLNENVKQSSRNLDNYRNDKENTIENDVSNLITLSVTNEKLEGVQELTENAQTDTELFNRKSEIGAKIKSKRKILTSPKRKYVAVQKEKRPKSKQLDIKVSPSSRLSSFMREKANNILKLASSVDKRSSKAQPNEVMKKASKLYDRGCNLYLKKKYKLSKKFFLDCITIAEDEDEMSRLHAQCLHNIGLIYYMEEDYKSSAAYYEKSVNVSTEINDSQLQAITLSNLGVLKYTQNNLDASREYLEEAVAIMEAYQLKFIKPNAKTFSYFPELYSTSSLYMAYLEEMCEQYHKAIPTYKKALSMFQSEDDKNGIAECYLRLGYSTIRIAEFEEASKYFQSATKLFKESNNYSSMIMSYIGNGICERECKNNMRSVKFMKLAMGIIKKRKIHNDLPFCWYETGLTHKYANNYDEALNCFENCLQSMEEWDVSDEYLQGLCYYNLGHIYHYNLISKDNEPNNAEIRSTLPSISPIDTVALSNHKNELSNREYVDISRKYYLISLNFLKSDRLIANVWHNIGSVEYNAKNYKESGIAFTKAKELYNALDDHGASLEVVKKLELLRNQEAKTARKD